MNSRQNQLQSINRLLDIMDDLRAKCPWDKKQTLESLRHLTIEEVYELGDAILDGNMDEIKKELGDLLLHMVFYAKIGSETGDFDIGSVAESISDKLVERHPHIYGDFVAADEIAVKQNWEKLKLKEGKKSVLEGVPKSLPALVKASRIQEKVAGVGFDWNKVEEVKAKLDEELREFDMEVQSGNQQFMEEEFGDVLFSMINYARFLNINPENALEKTNKKFMRRFQFIESKATSEGKSISDLSLEEMEHYWQMAKKN
ncbi:MAG: nucleoside triphosphate pyrophosphohydrolase [Bacteroidetes bacterium]|nr:nucleoside triphosphate pyrophosphohydrolase [Bacteroidota bacterium]MDA0879899.1 nucleoside triphosphate pyrophosphohydrolase [Bacteroidota bacterium]MDA1116038.1 nucleoside triphosphate pyrophosphohydrolase [Bacteroidota bacterium]